MPSQTHEVWLKSNMAQSHAGQMQVKNILYDMIKQSQWPSIVQTF